MAVENRVNLVTESRNPSSMNIDLLSTEEMLTVINREDARVTEAIHAVIPAISKAVDLITEKMRKGGRLLYIGAGTSGRMGVLDAVECGPTFSVEPGRVIGIIAGGKEAMFNAKESVEDNYKLGAREIIRHKVGADDCVVGIAASGKTPYVLGALNEAKKRGAVSIRIFCNVDPLMEQDVDVEINPVVGPEILTGSTRMKAGTAQKMVLNMISTAVMIKLGKVYSNLMVDLNATNHKLVERAESIFIEITGATPETAKKYLKQANYRVKPAIVMYERGCSLTEALGLLGENSGFLRKVIS
ncbi:MAG TPA: N-acetylmuramic acid 6-phosphate etherase [Firmicutes bacterium]|nr:N-acetylmuramic acid 6-phosphate etherase [Bacillota bacterium]